MPVHYPGAADSEELKARADPSGSGTRLKEFVFEKKGFFSTYRILAGFLKLAVYITMLTISITYCYDILEDLHKNNIVCFWNILCLFASVFFTVLMWDDYIDRKNTKTKSVEQNVISVLLFLLLVIPGTALGNPWMSFAITNTLTPPLEYPLVALCHLAMYCLSEACPGSLLSTIVSVAPGVIALCSLLEYEIHFFYKKALVPSKYKVTATGILTGALCVLSLAAYQFNLLGLAQPAGVRVNA
ncbi:uncharacterized protein NEMAJ01_1933 [Nematocida major]|uniref:uncharacterized protein n=1 Tax=Nematocida major TaxID=1912982 RepID=UPI002008679F|nr:uncharacterized protein NEMAJ01_1933 [Nematocida major]KAH9387037.1 hypothetical protein NEMAJ01_1933 [Nematocida major]